MEGIGLMDFEYRHRVIDDNPLGDILNNCVLGDLFNQGRTDMVIASGYNWGKDPILQDGYLYYYEGPEWKERHVIDTGQFQLSMLLHDLTGNGLPDLIVAHNFPPALYWYENPGAPEKLWKKIRIEDNLMHMYHDLHLADIDGDGKRELIVSSPFFYLGSYKIPDDPREENWEREIICFRNQHEGIVVRDLRGIGLPDIIAGPYHYLNPQGSPPRWPRWEVHKVTENFQDWCRLSWIQFKNGREGLVMIEGDYAECRLSWFEFDDDDCKWTEHPIDTGIYFGHTLRVVDLDHDGDMEIFAAEMAHGGYGASPRSDSRLMFYKCTNFESNQWEKEVISKGRGTHEAHLFLPTEDGRYHILGKTFQNKTVDYWEPVG